MIWAIICGVLSFLGFTNDSIAAGVLFAVICIVILFSNSKSKPSGLTQLEMNKFNERFDNNRLVKQIVQDIIANNYLDYDYKRRGIIVLTDRIVTASKTYKYSEYNLAKIDMKTCRGLAYYFGNILPKGIDFTVTTETSESLNTRATYYYETPGGHLASGGGDDVRVDRIGYRVYRTDTNPAKKQQKQPQGEKW